MTFWIATLQDHAMGEIMGTGHTEAEALQNVVRGFRRVTRDSKGYYSDPTSSGCKTLLDAAEALHDYFGIRRQEVDVPGAYDIDTGRRLV